jgi:hypothetical protein
MLDPDPYPEPDCITVPFLLVLTWILEGCVSMAPVGPLRDCQAIVVVDTAFLVSSSSFKFGVFHHSVTESSVAIFETLNILGLL